MKKKILCAILAVALLLAAVPAFAATSSVTYQGSCIRAFTPSVYLQRGTSEPQWGWLKVECSKSIAYYLGHEDELWEDDHILLVYDKNGSSAATPTFVAKHYGSGASSYTPISIYNASKSTTKLTFKVYNEEYYQHRFEGCKVSVKSKVTPRY